MQLIDYDVFDYLQNVWLCYTPNLATLKGGDPVRVNQGGTGGHNSETGSFSTVKEFGQ
jgi:hypothetical protein